MTTSFAYNGDGLRDSRTTGGSTVTFTWDVTAGLPQVLDDGAFRYVYGIGRIAEVGPGTTTHYYLADGLGSVMALTDASGAVVNAYDYDVFGAVRSQGGSQTNEFQFAGEQVDGSTGLQYLRARYYDMGTGRFIGKDPYGGSAALPGTQNGYVYSLNNPCTRIDPTGFASEGATTCSASATGQGGGRVFGILCLGLCGDGPIGRDLLFEVQVTVTIPGDGGKPKVSVSANAYQGWQVRGPARVRREGDILLISQDFDTADRNSLATKAFDPSYLTLTILVAPGRDFGPAGRDGFVASSRRGGNLLAELSKHLIKTSGDVSCFN